MTKLRPKDHHERLLAGIDHEKIVQYLNEGQERSVMKIAVTLARQCDLFVHFQRLWLLRVSDLDETLCSEQYMKEIYMNKRTLYKELNRPASSP